MRRAAALAVGLLLASSLAIGTSASTPSRAGAVPQDAFRPVEVPDAAPTPTPRPAAPAPRLAPILEPRPELPVPAEREAGAGPRAVAGVIDDRPSAAGAEPRIVGTVGVVEGSRIARAYAQSRLSDAQYQCLNKLWTRESGWRWNAENRSSGAYGIPQALPGTKMASAGADWRTNPVTQVKWGLGYISGRYGTACEAWAHSESRGWY